MTIASLDIKTALTEDVEAMNLLIQVSAMQLSQNFYSNEQIAALNRYVFGVDTALISDGSYFKVLRQNTLVACGGWSRRKTLYGGDQRRVGLPELLDPGTDAAKIRAFFVHPDHARQGIGRLLLNYCEEQARLHGFSRAELMATLPGVPLYQVCGFSAVETISDELPNGVTVTFVRMSKAL